MLQIISGKFFESEDRFSFEAKGITYCNFSWPKPIETCVATLHPVDTYSSVASYVINYINQIEKEKPPRQNILVKTGDSEILDQFLLLCTFGLRAFFHQDRDTVAVACRELRLSSSDYHIPSAFVPRYFQRQISGSNDEIESFVAFVKQVIGLPRHIYSAIMLSLKNFMHALQLIGHNIDLAYSLIIYSLESLSQAFDSFTPKWEDYQEKERIELDAIFKDLSSDTSKKIRSILLNSGHLKLMHRFTTFIVNHIDDSFFKHESPKGYAALTKSELVPALRNAYSARSKYAHHLQPIQEQLKQPHTSDGDVFRWENQPYLSMAGLVRIAHHAITKFIGQQKRVEWEQVNWRGELPGIIQAELAPQYWIWKHENIKPEHSTSKLHAFLCQLEGVFLRGESLTNLNDLLSKYEKLLPLSDKLFQLRMFALYFLYNGFVNKKSKSANHDKIIQNYSFLFDECSIEAMLSVLFVSDNWPWEINECVSSWEQYSKQKFRKTGLKIPVIWEILLLVELGNVYLEYGDTAKFKNYIDIAILESAGKHNLQKFLSDMGKEGNTITFQQLVDEAKK